MREGLIGAAVAIGLAMAVAGPLAAQQLQNPSAQPSIIDNEIGQSAPPAVKPAKRMHAQASPSNPDLDTDDQLAPSQMNQPVPPAVSEPGGPAVRKPARPAASAATESAPSAPPKARIAAAAPAHMVIACSGPFARDSGMLALAVAFDSKNVTFQEVDANGAKVAATIVYPKDPKKRLEVWWSNPGNRTGTYLIIIGDKSTWTAPGGMKLGLTLAQLEKLNHKPFKLKGFDKSGVATVSDWDGGALASLAGGCKSGVSLRADPKAGTDAVSALPADKEYSSADPEMRAVKPTISEILIGY